MKHHRYNQNFEFVIQPENFNKFTERDILQYCLGATLYMPGTKDIKNKIINKEINDITSFVMCFEDAIQEKDLPNAEQNVIEHLKTIQDALDTNRLEIDDLPLLFLRVRTPEQFRSFASKLNAELAQVISGFVFPKFYSFNASEYLKLLVELNQKFSTKLYGMPILEGKRIAYKETRIDELLSLKSILEPYKDYILNIRVGGTDFSALFGVRRGINYSIYDIMTVRDCLSDILNFFKRGNDYVVSGTVWEYFLADSSENINSLLEENLHISLLNRNPILNEAIDGLLREVILDKANGIVGKTIIHPSHSRFVNALHAVTNEEYDDALQIMNTIGGVVKSAKANKMNEINPHRSWAKEIITRAQIYGVIENDLSYLKLITVKD